MNFVVEIEVPDGLKAGDRFAVTIDAPNTPRVRRTLLVDTPLADMTLEELKRERINARSVLYKATRRANEKAILAATKRLNKVAEEIAKRLGVTIYEEVNAPEGLFEDENASPTRLH